MYQKILVPLDGSATAERGLQEAIALAARLQSRLALLHVIDAYPLMVEMASVVNTEAVRESLRRHGQEVLARAQAAATERGVASDTHLQEVTNGRVAEMILSQARELGCDLVVMGTHGRRGLSRTLLGSDAEWVLRNSGLPVLLVRRPEGTP